MEHPFLYQYRKYGITYNEISEVHNGKVNDTPMYQLVPNIKKSYMTLHYMTMFRSLKHFNQLNN